MRVCGCAGSGIRVQVSGFRVQGVLVNARWVRRRGNQQFVLGFKVKISKRVLFFSRNERGQRRPKEAEGGQRRPKEAEGGRRRPKDAERGHQSPSPSHGTRRWERTADWADCVGLSLAPHQCCADPPGATLVSASLNLFGRSSQTASPTALRHRQATRRRPNKVSLEAIGYGVTFALTPCWSCERLPVHCPRRCSMRSTCPRARIVSR